MTAVIVPDALRARIHEAIDRQAALEQFNLEPDNRESIYSQLLDYYAEHGEIPEFEIAPEVDLAEIDAIFDYTPPNA